MRKLILGSCLALAACGGGEDFALDVAMPATTAYADLSRFSGSQLTNLLGLPAVSRETPEEGEVVYTIASLDSDEPGRMAFLVEPVDAGKSRIHVTLDLPDITMTDHGQNKILSEPKSEAMLRQQLENWARARSSGESATGELGKLDLFVGAMALVVSPSRHDKARSLAALDGQLADFGGMGGSIDGFGSESRPDLTAREIVPEDPTYRGQDDPFDDGEAGGWGE
ncbi:hypothetical protein B2G71_13220 [Novosphingobium sp. PC22D]|uniref:hypothetical protein n=1 Tax=Novosphingobium sp. PC22D TaxID=1962403 RepID=UPI000BF19F67|nr:hypothetical protein [Novosphingobium sp. PC22D]PEQ12099.1 hypothetical protein B2G71_13220 [Novosphingobium sp. PC22D]